MSGGEWLIRQHPPGKSNAATNEGYRVHRITLENDPDGGTEPEEIWRDYGLCFRYADGHHVIYTWASIISAEYRPHPDP